MCARVLLSVINKGLKPINASSLYTACLPAILHFVCLYLQNKRLHRYPWWFQVWQYSACAVQSTFVIYQCHHVVWTMDSTVLWSAWTLDLTDPLSPLCECIEETRPCFSYMDYFPVMVLCKKKKKVQVNRQTWLLGICFSKCKSWSRLFAQLSFGVDGRLSPTGWDAARTAHWFSKQRVHTVLMKCLQNA